MVFDKKFSLSLTPSKEEVYPGDFLEADIIIRPEEKFHIIRLTACLENVHEVIWYSVQAHVMQFNAYTVSSSQRERIPIIHIKETLVEHLEVEPGREYKYSFRAKIPDDAIPTFTGNRIRTTYYLKVKAEIKWGLDREEKKEIIVLQKPEPGDIVEYKTALDKLNITLKVRSTVLSGGILEGEMVILPTEDKEYLGIRADIIRVEDIFKYNQREERKIVSEKIIENVKFLAGKEEQIGFKIRIPDKQASFRTNVSAVEYYLVIVLEKKYRPDKFIRIPIKVLRTNT